MNKSDAARPLGPISSAAADVSEEGANASAIAHRRTAALLIATFTVVRLGVIATTPIANGEAYYLSWSRFLDWSYFDHPPMIAWLARLTTFFELNDFTARLAPVALSALTAGLLYRLTERLFTPRAAIFALVIVSVTPSFVVHSYALNPEGPLAPAWVGCLLAVEGMRQGREAYRPLLVGLLVGLAFLGKYTGILLVPATLIYLAISPKMRRWYRRPALYGGGLVALAVAAPVIYWNVTHDWASVAYHFGGRSEGVPPVALGARVLEIGVGTIALYSPLMLPLLLGALVVAVRRRTDDRYRFLLAYSVPVLAFLYFMMGSVGEPEFHWGMVGFLTLMVGLGALLDEHIDQRPWLQWLYRGAVGFSALAFVAVNVHIRTDVVLDAMGDSYDGRFDFANEFGGWPEVEDRVARLVQENGSRTVVAGSYYSVCGKLMSVVDDSPPVYCPGALNAFHFLERGEPPADRPVIFVNNDRYAFDPSERLPDRACTEVPGVELERGDRVVRRYRFWTCAPRGGEGSP